MDVVHDEINVAINFKGIHIIFFQELDKARRYAVIDADNNLVQSVLTVIYNKRSNLNFEITGPKTFVKKCPGTYSKFMLVHTSILRISPSAAKSWN